jgi:triosephosphate isomerase
MSKIVVGNLKMFLSNQEMKDYINDINKVKLNNTNLILCPSYIYLNLFKDNNYLLGAQNVFYKENGAYTGEISARQLKDLNVSYVIIGHQERRKYFNESDKDINLKIKSCLKENLKVILCIGETKEENEMKKTSIVLRKQIMKALEDISIENLNNIIIAYEPEYSIGTNNCIDISKIKEITKYIKTIIYNNYNCDIKVIYGGSVNLDNVKDITLVTDGVLVGKLSSECKKFINLLNKLE